MGEIDSSSSRYVSQMYDQAAELETAYNTWRSLRKEGKTEEAADYFADNKDSIAKRELITRAKGQVTAQNKRIREIERSDMTPDQKRESILRIRKMQHEVAQMATR